MSEEKVDSLVEQVLQIQIVIARHLGLDRDVVDFLESIPDWKKREWYYIAALDGMSVQDLRQMEEKNIGVSQIRKERILFIKKLYSGHDELGEQFLQLQREVMETKQHNEELRKMLEESQESFRLQSNDSYEIRLEKKEQRIRILEKELEQRQMDTSKKYFVTRCNLKNYLKKRKKKKMLEVILANEQMSDKQKDFLLDCLEEGIHPEEIMEFADPNFSIEIMKRLKELQQRGKTNGSIRRSSR